MDWWAEKKVQEIAQRFLPPDRSYYAKNRNATMEKLSENIVGNMHSSSLKAGMIGFLDDLAAAKFGNNWTTFTIFNILC